MIIMKTKCRNANVMTNRSKQITVDLHKMSREEAVHQLDNALYKASDEIDEIIVIHGYRNGSKLLELVRHQYNNSSIQRKFVSLNPGRTYLILHSNWF